MADQTTLYILLAAFAVLILALVVLRSRRQRVSLDEPAARPLERRFAAPPPPTPEGQGVADEAAAAVENVVGEIIGVDAHHDRALDATPAPADRLTALKGLGPKAEAQLNALGISRYEQLAALTPVEAEALDTRMGAFKGRLARDRWIEQAGYLATGDRDGFEAVFGKLG